MDLNVAKGITLFVLFLIPIVLGSLTLYLFTRYRPNLFDSSQGLSFLSYLKCFSGGFFLGISLLVVLSQGLERFEEYRHLVGLRLTFPFFEIGIGAGFFLVALVEKLIYLTFAQRQTQDADKMDQEETRIFQMTPQSSSSTLKELHDDNMYKIPDDTLEILAENRDQKQHPQTHMSEDRVESPKTTSRGIQHGDDDGKAPPKIGDKNRSDEAGSGGESLSQESGSDTGVSTLRIGMLVLALSFHTVFDGLAVGLQTKIAEVFSLLLAIAFHKAVTSVVMGIELARAFTIQTPFPFIALLLFSLASPLGVAIGVGVTSGLVHQSAKLLMGAMLQAVATGVFLYVTCFEILERDMAARKDLGAVLRVVTAIVGFGLIAAIETAAKG